MKIHLKSIALPLLVAAYPILFLYGHNAWEMQMGSLKVPLGFSIVVAGAAYGLFILLQRKAVTASLSATAFVLFYYSYGFIYRLLVKQDKFQVEHFTLLPLIVVLAIYAGYFLAHLRLNVARVTQNILLGISGFLVVVNVAITTPVEVQKALPKPAPAPARAPVPVTGSSASASRSYPDIYYIIFDEYVGFDAMRDYWHNPEVDPFEAFLKQNHFYVAASRTPTINTQTEMASRLNLHQYPDPTDPKITSRALDNNKVMQVLKSYGYSTAVLNMWYQGIPADYSISYDPQQVQGMAVDEFNQTFFDETMFDAFSDYFEASDAAEIKQRDLLLYTLDQTVNLPNTLGSPRFVYTHLLLPHRPFMFDENGNLLPPQDAEDWHYYLGQYQYATKLAQQLVTKLLANADPNNPPVIILQSDEGARNLQRRTSDNIVMNGYLENFPAQYAEDILNAMYLPGFDTSQLSINIAPIDTFVVVLNHYLNAGVAVDKTPAK